MDEQKICIIGDGLAGLSAATILSEQNIKIDFYTGTQKKNYQKIDNRTTAVSESSYQFFKQKLNIKSQRIFWGCKEINLFYQDKKSIKNFLNFEEKKKNLMYIFKNKELKKTLDTEIKKKKNIKIIKKGVTNIDYKNNSVLVNKNKFYFYLIILSIGVQSKLYNKITKERSIKKNYEEVAITTNVKHNFKINKVSQFFLAEGPLAILPFNKNSFSVVWSVSSSFFNKNNKLLKNILNNKIKMLLNDLKIKKIDKIQSFPISLNLKTKYFKKNVVILGDGLHAVHPMAGQGFNLVLRDIKKLEELMSKILRLGLLINKSFLLKDFYDTRKPENIILGLGINLTNIFFKNNNFFFPIKRKILNNIKNFEFIKKISKSISDKGISG